VKLNVESYVLETYQPQYLVSFDEVGRGAIAGPVVVGLTVWKVSDRFPSWAPLINDSKLLSPKKRDLIFDTVMKDAPKFVEVETMSSSLQGGGMSELYLDQTSSSICSGLELIAVGIGQASSQLIDQVNIWQAIQLAVQEVLESFDFLENAILLVDGSLSLKLKKKIHQILVIKGDLRSFTIGLSSCLAKVYRDRMMSEMDSNYAFSQHKGYGTEAHFKAIRTLGPLPHLHRLSFLTKLYD